MADGLVCVCVWEVIVRNVEGGGGGVCKGIDLPREGGGRCNKL